MNKDIPKPYLELCGKTILERTIKCFLPLSGLEQVIVATSEEYLEKAQQILSRILPERIDGQSLVGGSERQDSIYNALAKISDVDLVIVHDAVRPFVKLVHIEECCRVASQKGAAVLGIPARNTIKRVDDQQIVLETPPRKYLWQTQTPQVFHRQLILKAYDKAMHDNFTGTDDASLVERLDEKVQMVESDQYNFKITYPLDLKLVQLLIEEQQK